MNKNCILYSVATQSTIRERQPQRNLRTWSAVCDDGVYWSYPFPLSYVRFEERELHDSIAIDGSRCGVLDKPHALYTKGRRIDPQLHQSVG